MKQNRLKLLGVMVISVWLATACANAHSPSVASENDAIYGGSVDYTSHPSAVSLWYTGRVGNALGIRASGVIVGPHLVLTSAHVLEHATELLNGASGSDGDPPITVLQGDVNPQTFDPANARIGYHAFLHPAYQARRELPGFAPENDIAFVITEGAPFDAKTIAVLGGLSDESTVDCDFDLIGYGKRSYADSQVPDSIFDTERKLAPLCLAPRGYLAVSTEFRQTMSLDIAEPGITDEVFNAYLTYRMEEIVPNWDKGRKRVFLPTISDYHQANDPKDTRPAGAACVGDSGSGVYDHTSAKLVGLASANSFSPCDSSDGTIAQSVMTVTDLGAHRAIVDYFNAYQRFPSTDQQCMDERDGWCWKAGSAQPSCGELGRMEGFDLLGFYPYLGWNESQHGWRLNCVTPEREAAYDDAIAGGEPWFRLNRGQFANTWDCAGCYLWTGGTQP